MKENKKRLVIFFSIIFILSIIAGYLVYREYTSGQNSLEEEINLGSSKFDQSLVDDGSNDPSKEKNATGKTGETGNDKNSDSNNSKTSDNKPCCDTCKGNSFCLANCKSCDSNKESGSSSEKESEKEKDGVCEKEGSGWMAAAISWSDPDCREQSTEKILNFINPCSYVTVSLPGELSPDSTAFIYVTIDRDALPAGYNKECIIPYTIDGVSSSRKITVSKNVFIKGIAMKRGGFKPCQKVTMSVTKSGVTTSKTIVVKTKFSEEIKNKNLSGESEIPNSPERADELGKSFYGECNDDKTNCKVRTRNWCSPQARCYYNASTYKYCWGTSCGEGYVIENNTKESECKNICYCNSKGNCGIWAKKDYSSDSSWNGYNVIKDSNGNYIYDSDKCVMYNYCCVNNGILDLSSEVKYKEFVAEKSCPANWTLLENVSKADCKVDIVEGSCNISDTSSKKTGQAKECEDKVSIVVDEGKKCTNTVENEKTSFYEISCAKTVTTGFDYGNDGDVNTTRALYKGEGFAFGINVETSVYCKYTFYDDVWKKAYNKAIDKIKKIDSNLVQYVKKNQADKWKKYIDANILTKSGVHDASVLYDLWNTIENLVNSVKVYNTYDPSNSYNENGEITLEVDENGKSVVTKHKLISVVEEEGTYKTSGSIKKKLNVSLVDDPKNYILSSDKTRKVLLIPKRVCIDRGTGKFTTIEGAECPKNTIDGGNKIYTNMATDATDDDETYPISIKVEGLGLNGSKVLNNKCDIEVGDSKYIYRPIDLKNPFINSTWQKGKNWINESFDFTKVINENTWSNNSNKKVVTLTSKDIISIKESNTRAWKDNNSPYMGLCNKQSEKLQDEITKKLCSLLK